MPVHPPGPRLYSSVPFQHLGGKGKEGGGHDPNVFLNLTAMVDMMTMLVVFLLSTFSATGELIMAQKGLELPTALNNKDLERAAIITITKNEVSFDGKPMGTIESLTDETVTDWNIPPLYESLQLYGYELAKRDMPEAQREKLRHLVVLQADKGTPAKVLNRIMKTAYKADFTEVMFAIQIKRKPTQ
jgi:biopolymer transport protein ExbD